MEMISSKSEWGCRQRREGKTGTEGKKRKIQGVSPDDLKEGARAYEKKNHKVREQPREDE